MRYTGLVTIGTASNRRTSKETNSGTAVGGGFDTHKTSFPHKDLEYNPAFSEKTRQEVVDTVLPMLAARPPGTPFGNAARVRA